jgi:hypothetical protein
MISGGEGGVGATARSCRLQLGQNRASVETGVPHISQNGVAVPSTEEVPNPA